MNISSILRTGMIISSLCGAVTYTSVADAAQGCGQGFHRNGYGQCVLNHPGPYARPLPYQRCWRNHWGQVRCYR